MLYQIYEFILRHWALVGLFIILFILVVIEEARTKGMIGGLGIIPQQLIQWFNREEAVVLDIRDNNAFKEGHIIGAINIPHDVIEQNLQKLEPHKQKRIVIVCSTGQKSMAVVNQLKKQGFEKVYFLTGGMQAWKQASMPIVKK